MKADGQSGGTSEPRRQGQEGAVNFPGTLVQVSVPSAQPSRVLPEGVHLSLSLGCLAAALFSMPSWRARDTSGCVTASETHRRLEEETVDFATQRLKKASVSQNRHIYSYGARAAASVTCLSFPPMPFVTDLLYKSSQELTSVARSHQPAHSSSCLPSSLFLVPGFAGCSSFMLMTHPQASMVQAM